MSEHKIITAGIIIIGNEILSGRTQDVNIQHIGLKLNEHGVHVREVRIIPDIESSIVDTVRALKQAYDYVFTTGGIGPTHDDITAESMAKAFNRDLEFNAIALDILYARYGTDRLTEGRKNMARMPVGAELIKNPVSAAPGFQVENVFVMAGIPDVMRGMLDFALEKVIPGTPIMSSAVHCMLAEGDLAKGLRELQEANSDVDIGSYPFWRLGRFGTNVVVRGQNTVSIDKVTALVKELMVSLGGEPEVEMLEKK
jgi:molybdenum cofactor synthesis domain-containing protein